MLLALGQYQSRRAVSVSFSSHDGRRIPIRVSFYRLAVLQGRLCGSRILSVWLNALCGQQWLLRKANGCLLQSGLGTAKVVKLLGIRFQSI